MLTGAQPYKTAALIVIIMLLPVLALSSLIPVHTDISPGSISYALMDKSNLHISISAVNTGIHTLAANPENGFVVKVRVANENGAAIPGAGIKLDVFPSIGSFSPAEGITDTNGCFLSVYTPPPAVNEIGDSASDESPAAASTLNITSRLAGTDKSSTMQINLIPVPVVFIHGYQATPDIFSGMSAYLRQNGFKTMSFSYPSENGVAASAASLADFLQDKAVELESSGIQVNRFDIIAHSMGGLVARYYTCSNDYAAGGNVRKLIFISVPQKGSPFASLGLHFFGDSGIQDLVPDSRLYISSFPLMINEGLNPSIQTGSILGKYDEVVGLESASLSEWKIETELFDLGDNNFTADKLQTGEILYAYNHKLILYNKKVYNRVKQMLETKMSFPIVKKK